LWRPNRRIYLGNAAFGVIGGNSSKESAVPIHVLAPIGLALVITILGKRWF
jgi:hypothetical protein